LQRMLRPMRHEWNMTFAQGGEEAISVLEPGCYDIVVSDMRMPGMNGAQLLTEVMKRHPEVVRIILSGQSDEEAMLHSVGLAHQYLSKPCDADTLRATLARACAQRDLLTNKPLQQVISRMVSLPSLPSLYAEIVAALQSGDVSTRQVGNIIAKDIGMTAKILQVANSSFFGLPRPVSCPIQAVSVLGIETMKTLVLSCQVFSLFNTTTATKRIVESLQDHSMKVGNYARLIAVYEGLTRQDIEETFTAGLLHDVGKLVLMTNFPSQYVQTLQLARLKNLSMVEAEQTVLEATHAEVGAYLLGLWGFSSPVVEALALHHAPLQSHIKLVCPLTVVHVANALAYESPDANLGTAPNERIDQDYLQSLGACAKLPAWRRMCHEAQG
jgi:HD-like signal output (HDOD) protein